MRDRNSEALREDNSRLLFTLYYSLYFRLLESKQSFMISMYHIYSASCMHTQNTPYSLGFPIYFDKGNVYGFCVKPPNMATMNCEEWPVSLPNKSF